MSEDATQVVRLQSELLDYTGHVRKGTPRQRAKELVDEINRVRSVLGWRPLDMTGRWKR